MTQRQGVATREPTVEELRRFLDEVFVAYDGDLVTAPAASGDQKTAFIIASRKARHGIPVTRLEIEANHRHGSVMDMLVSRIHTLQRIASDAAVTPPSVTGMNE